MYFVISFRIHASLKALKAGNGLIESYTTLDYNVN
jgi:hypothetical protein